MTSPLTLQAGENRVARAKVTGLLLPVLETGIVNGVPTRHVADGASMVMDCVSSG